MQWTKCARPFSGFNNQILQLEGSVTQHIKPRKSRLLGSTYPCPRTFVREVFHSRKCSNSVRGLYSTLTCRNIHTNIENSISIDRDLRQSSTGLQSFMAPMHEVTHTRSLVQLGSFLPSCPMSLASGYDLSTEICSYGN